MNYLNEHGADLIANFYEIVPIKRGYKYPRGLDNWQLAPSTQNQLDLWINELGFEGVGIRTQNTPAVDLDIRDQDVVDRLVSFVEKHVGETIQRIGHAPKTLLVYRTDEPFTKLSSNTYVDFLGQEHKVEILGSGQQFVAFAEHPDTKRPYAWVNGQSPVDVIETDLPTLSLQQAQEIIAFFEDNIPIDWELKPGSSKSGTKQMVDLSLPVEERVLMNAAPKTDLSVDEIRDVLSTLIEQIDTNRAFWLEVGMALYHQYDGGPRGFYLWDEWSQNSVKYDYQEIKELWPSFEPDLATTKPLTFATIIYRAKQAQQKNNLAIDTGPFEFIHVDGMVSKLKPVEWLIEDYLEVSTAGVMFGDPGTFKSFLALDMGFHVAVGKDWHGKQVRQGPVIYIAGEGHGGLARRSAAWSKHHNMDTSEIPLYFSKTSASLFDKEAVENVKNAVHQIAKQTGSPAMIVVDTLARNMGGGDENSNADIGVFFDHICNDFRDHFDAVVVVVHHSGHANKQRARGASALKAATDFEYQVDKLEGTLKTKLHCCRMKDAPEGPDRWFEGQEVCAGTFDDAEISSLVFDLVDAPVTEEKPLKGKQLALFNLIESEAPIERETLRELALNEGVFETSQQFRAALTELKKKEKITENDNQINTFDAFWTGADEAQKSAEK